MPHRLRHHRVAAVVLCWAMFGGLVATFAGTHVVAADPNWVCGAYDQSAKRGMVPEPDGSGRTFPVVTIHGITGSDSAFDGIIDQSYDGVNPQPPRSLFDALAGRSSQPLPPGLPYMHVYSFSYSPDSLRWVNDNRVGGTFAATIDCLYQMYATPVSVVAHSMGGLVTRWVANTTDRAGVSRAIKLGKVVTLGTPYEGSELAAASGGTGDVLGAQSPWVWLVSYLCGQQGTATGNGSCGGVPLLALGNSDAGRALRAGSAELQALKKWPAGVDVFAIAGSSVFRATLFGAKLSSFDAGDIVVGTDSATADAPGSEVVSCRYDVSGTAWFDDLKGLLGLSSIKARKAKLAEFVLSQPCYHSNLMRNVEATNEVLGQLNDWIAARATPPISNTPIDFVPEPETGPLRLAYQGTRVKVLQIMLQTIGKLTDPPDGYFGHRTEAALKAFQRDANLAADGIAGSESMHALDVAVGGTPFGTLADADAAVLAFINETDNKPLNGWLGLDMKTQQSGDLDPQFEWKNSGVQPGSLVLDYYFTSHSFSGGVYTVLGLKFKQYNGVLWYDGILSFYGH